MKNQNLWLSLGQIYLKDYELINSFKKENRKSLQYLIKTRLYEDIWNRMNANGEIKPPFLTNYNSRFIRNDRKAEIIETDDIEWAELVIKKSKFYIFINKGKSETQKRTLLAHEIGHTFLFKIDKDKIKSLTSGTEMKNIGKQDYHEEGLVYEIGRHIIIPTAALKERISDHPSLDAFLVACDKNNFYTTKDIMARRLYRDVFELKDRSSYWKNSILILYPIKKGVKNYRVPRGNNEVFHGTQLQNINIEKQLWMWLKQFIELSLKNEKRTIFSRFYDNFDWYKPLFLYNEEYEGEFRYIPIEKRLIILISQKTDNASKRDSQVTLNKF